MPLVLHRILLILSRGSRQSDGEVRQVLRLLLGTVSGGRGQTEPVGVEGREAGDGLELMRSVISVKKSQECLLRSPPSSPRLLSYTDKRRCRAASVSFSC